MLYKEKRGHVGRPTREEAAQTMAAKTKGEIPAVGQEIIITEKQVKKGRWVVPKVIHGLVSSITNTNVFVLCDTGRVECLPITDFLVELLHFEPVTKTNLN